MKLLTIDIGNTNTHFFDHQEEKLKKDINNFEHYDTIIYSSVLSNSDLKKRHPHFNFKEFINAKDFVKNHSFQGMPIHYSSQELGIDRVLCAYAQYPSTQSHDELLILDAGTFLTIDHVNSNGFQSGFIAQGIYTYLTAYSKGSKLPVMNMNELLENSSSSDLTATCTKEAIAKTIKITYQSLVNTFLLANKFIYTGGDALLLEKIINRPGIHKPHLIHLGMKNLAKSL